MLYKPTDNMAVYNMTQFNISIIEFLAKKAIEPIYDEST